MVPAGELEGVHRLDGQLRYNWFNEARKHEAILHATSLEVNERPTATRRIIERQNIEARPVNQRLDNGEVRTGTAAKLQVGANADHIGPQWHRYCARCELVLDHADELLSDFRLVQKAVRIESERRLANRIGLIAADCNRVAHAVLYVEINNNRAVGRVVRMVSSKLEVGESAAIPILVDQVTQFGRIIGYAVSSEYAAIGVGIRDRRMDEHAMEHAKFKLVRCRSRLPDTEGNEGG